MMHLKNYIGGEFKSAHSGATLPGYEPATGSIYCHIPDSDQKDVEAAVRAAALAFPLWSRTTPTERARVLRKISDGIERRLEELAHAESVDNGKPLSLARTVDIPRSAANFSFFADAITQFSSETHQTSPEILNYTLRAPLGIVGCISPWNLPLYLLTWKIAPALAAGNCVIAKPSEVTPVTAFLLGEICEEAGLPAGALNIVHGLGNKVGAALVSHPEVKAVSFTGSTLTGKAIASIAAPQFKKLSLEMGGKNPTIVFHDAEMDRAIDGAFRAAFTNQGQICLCGSRILVQEKVYSRFREGFLEKMRALKIGDPLEASTTQGALVSREHQEKVLRAIETAKSEGGKVTLGGKAAHPAGRCQGGWFIEPTLIEGLDLQCSTNQEEIFGPVATLIPFSTESEAIAAANCTPYGLAASIWTQDLNRAHRVAQSLESGIVWINCWMVRDLRTPFGGVKNSGVGREGGLEALRFFTEPKNICLQVTQ